jgi:transcriptional regulator with PAS, ATPase and Fis domain
MNGETRTKTDDRVGGDLVVARRTDLFVIVNGDRPLDGGARYSLREIDSVSFGRGDAAARRQRAGAENRLVVAMPNDHVSKAHAVLRRLADGWALADDESKNGTFLNGQKVTRPMPVRPGDIIQLGSVFCGIRESVVADDIEIPEEIAIGAAGASAAFSEVPTLVPFLAARLSRAWLAASSRDPIVIVGETGTGKEILARAIHRTSGRKGRFVPVNCAELAPSIVESQLFGYLKGAYSGAGGGDPGYVVSADGGTLLLDEVLELPLPIQAKLLRVIQEGEVTPLGRSRSQGVEVRFLAATQKRLSAVVEAGQFRPDLEARLEHHVAELPALRERREDLGVLISVILARLGAQESQCLTFLPATVLRMLTYDWPLNIRQLDKALARAMQFARAGVLDERALFQDPDVSPDRKLPAPALSDVDHREREQLAGLLDKHGGNVTAVARELNKHKALIYQALDRLDLNQKQFRPPRAR